MMNDLIFILNLILFDKKNLFDKKKFNDENRSKK